MSKTTIILNILLLITCNTQSSYSAQHQLQLFQTSNIIVPINQLPNECVESIIHDDTITDKQAELQACSDQCISSEARRYIMGTTSLCTAQHEIKDLLASQPDTTTYPRITIHDYSILKAQPQVTVTGDTISITADVTHQENQNILNQIICGYIVEQNRKKYFQKIYEETQRTNITN